MFVLRKVETLLGRKQIKQLSAGLYQTWAVLEDGELRVWGVREGYASKAIPTQSLRNRKCKQVSCGQRYTAILFESGEPAVMVYTDQGGLVPIFPLEEGSPPIKQVACSDDHLLLLFENGDGDKTNWKQLSFCSKPIAHIAVGQMYSAAVTTDGELYTWGIGPLGHSINVKQDPDAVKAMAGKKVVFLACGSFHMTCVTQSGELYTWGSSVWNQLGHGDHKNTTEPRRVAALEGKRVVEASCGAYHTVVRTDMGRIYTFGGGRHGALGHGDVLDQDIPRLVDELSLRYVKHIACGWYHSVVVVGTDPNMSLLRQDMQKLLYNDSEFADVTVHCVKEPLKSPLKCHKVVLAARCKKIADMIDRDHTCNDLFIDQMDYFTFTQFFHFLYTDTTEPNIGLGTLLNLLFLGIEYDLPILRRRCRALFVDALSLENVLERWEILHERSLSLDDSDLSRKWRQHINFLKLEAVNFILKEDSNLDNLEVTKPEALSTMAKYHERLFAALSSRSAKRGSSLALSLSSSSTSGEELDVKTVEDDKNEQGEKPEEAANQEQEKEEEKTDPSASNPVEQSILFPEDDLPSNELKLSSMSVGQDRSYTLDLDLSKYFKNSKFSDVSFSVEGEILPAHKAILCGRSEHFRAMFSSGMKESQADTIEVHDISLPIFNSLLQYLYSGISEINEENVVELLMIANQYTLTHLQEQCECYVEKGIYKDNAAHILEMAHRYQTHHLRTIAMNYMLKQRDHVVRTEGFQELSPELLQEFKQNVACAKTSVLVGTGASSAFEGETAFFKIEAYDEFGNRSLRGGENFKVRIVEETPDERQARKKRQLEEAIKKKEEAALAANAKKKDGDSDSDDRLPKGNEAQQNEAGKGSLSQNSSASPEELSGEEKEKEKETEKQKDKGKEKEKEEKEIELVDSDVDEPPIELDNIEAEEQIAEERLWFDNDETEFWLCEKCTLLNSKSLICAACDAERPVVSKTGSSRWIKALHLLGNNEGAYLVSYVPMRAGRYSIHVSLGDEPLAKSPYFLRVAPGTRTLTTYSAAKCTASGEGLKRAEVFNEATFTIQARDSWGRLINTGGKWFMVRITTKEEDSFLHMDWHAEKGIVTDNNDGTYSVRYIHTIVGPFYVSVLLGHMHIFGSPFTVLGVPTKSCATKCTAFGEGIEKVCVGRFMAFTIQAKDTFGNARDKGGDNFMVIIRKAGREGEEEGAGVGEGDGEGDETQEKKQDLKPSATYPEWLNLSIPSISPPLSSVSDISDEQRDRKRDRAKEEEKDKAPQTKPAGETTGDTPKREFRRARRRAGRTGGTEESSTTEPLVNKSSTTTDTDSSTTGLTTPESCSSDSSEIPKPVSSAQRARLAEEAVTCAQLYDITVKDQGIGVYFVEYRLREEGLYRIHIYLEGNPITGSPFHVECSNMQSPLALFPPDSKEKQSSSSSLLTFIDEKASTSPSRRKGRKHKPKKEHPHQNLEAATAETVVPNEDNNNIEIPSFADLWTTPAEGGKDSPVGSTTFTFSLSNPSEGNNTAMDPAFLSPPSFTAGGLCTEDPVPIAFSSAPISPSSSPATFTFSSGVTPSTKNATSPSRIKSHKSRLAARSKAANTG